MGSRQYEVPSLDDCLAALNHVNRRRVLLSLLDSETHTGGAVGLESLPLHSSESHPRVALQHVHLPKLTELGLVEADWERQTVRAGPQFEEIVSLLKLLDDNRQDIPGEWV